MKTTIKASARILAVFTIVAGLFALSACNSTKVSQSWKSPEVETLSFNKILVIAPISDGAMRRTLEDEIGAKVMANAKLEVIPSYKTIPSSDSLKNYTNVQEAVFRSHADGLVIVRPVSNRTELNVSPAPYPPAYRTFRGYWGAYGVRPLAYTSDVYTNQIVTVETNIYNAHTFELLWSGTTETTDPSSASTFVDSVSTAIREELKKQGLIPAK